MVKRDRGTKCLMHVLQRSTRWDAGATREDRHVLETSCSGPCLWHLGFPLQHDEHLRRRADIANHGILFAKGTARYPSGRFFSRCHGRHRHCSVLITLALFNCDKSLVPSLSYMTRNL